MFDLFRQQPAMSSPIEIGRLRHKYGRDFPRVVSNRINDRTLSTGERDRWRVIAQQI